MEEVEKDITEQLRLFLKSKRLYSKFVREVVAYRKRTGLGNAITNIANGFEWQESENKHDYWLKRSVQFEDQNK